MGTARKCPCGDATGATGACLPACRHPLQARQPCRGPYRAQLPRPNGCRTPAAPSVPAAGRRCAWYRYLAVGRVARWPRAPLGALCCRPVAVSPTLPHDVPPTRPCAGSRGLLAVAGSRLIHSAACNIGSSEEDGKRGHHGVPASLPEVPRRPAPHPQQQQLSLASINDPETWGLPSSPAAQGHQEAAGYFWLGNSCRCGGRVCVCLLETRGWRCRGSSGLMFARHIMVISCW